jgi:hypothetical protein
MAGIRIIRVAAIFILPLLFYSCDENGSSQRYLPPFEVTVTDTLGRPIEGAILEGGIDWDHFRETTDSRGRAVMPGFARDVRTIIRKSNYFSIYETYLHPAVYVLMPTPKVLVDLGAIEGDLISFEFFKILTINYQGEYRVYDFNGSSLSENMMVEFPPAVKEFKLFGDLLWYTTHDDGIYVYSLFNPLNPFQYFHLDIDGYLGPFDVKDSLVAVTSNYRPGPIRLLSYHTDGTVNELDRIGDFSANKIYFLGDYLIITGYGSGYTIFDVADPSDIRLAHNGSYGRSSSSFLRGDTLILAPDYGDYNYVMIDLSDPANPEEFGRFSATGRIDHILNDSTAIGEYYYEYQALCVFDRTSPTNFDAVAMVSEFYGYQGHHGGSPPYYLIGGRLWRLENR